MVHDCSMLVLIPNFTFKGHEMEPPTLGFFVVVAKKWQEDRGGTKLTLAAAFHPVSSLAWKHMLSQA